MLSKPTTAVNLSGEIIRLLFALCDNDNPLITKLSNADGCHIGQKDMDIIKSRKILGKSKIIGVTCHNSKFLALKAKWDKVDHGE